MAREEMIFSDYLDVLLRKKWFVISITLLVAALTYWWARQEIVIYKSKSRIKIQRQINLTEMFNEVMVSSGDPIDNYTYEITSFVVASNAAGLLAAPLAPPVGDIFALHGAIQVERIKGTDLLDVFVTGVTPVEAKRRAEAVVAAFIAEHDYAFRKNAQDVYKSITESYEHLMSDFKKRQSELLQNLGPRMFDSHEYDELTPLRKRLEELQLKLNDLRISGNFTETYPELINTKAQIALIEEDINRRLKVEFDRRTQLDQYERYKTVMNDIELFFSKRVEEAKIAVNKKSEVVLVIEPADDGQPATTGRLRKTVAGALLGLMLGVVLAFVADNLDTSVRTIGEVEDIFHFPVLGVIPHFSLHDDVVPIGTHRFIDYVHRYVPLDSFKLLWRVATAGFGKSGKDREKSPELIVAYQPRSPATEAYRTLRTNMQLKMEQGKNVFLMTSAGPAEGKTTTISNLAISFAQAGKRVLLVNANMRRPQICRIFGLIREKGLSDILVGDLAWRDAVKDYRDVALGDSVGMGLATTPGMDNLFFITCGGRTIHPAEWLSQPKLADLFVEWASEYDIVLTDAPPVLPVPDSVILGAVVKQTILVYQIGETARETIRRAIALLQNAGASVSGLVLNDLRSSWASSPEFFNYRMYYGRQE